MSTPPSPAAAPDFLSPKEAAALLRCNVKTIHLALAEGTLPHLRLGRVIRIPRAALELHLARKVA